MAGVGEACGYVAYFAETSGFGEAARSHLSALLHAGHTVAARSVLLTREGAPTPVRPDRRAYPRIVAACRARRAYRTLLVHAPPQHFPLLREQGCRNVGITAWETERLPRGWPAALETVDEVWVPSAFCREAFASATHRAVYVVPHPVSVPDLARSPIAGVPDDMFLFLAILEWSDRKNPVGLLRAFLDAFAGRRDVGLLIKAGTGFTSRDAVLRRIARVERSYARPRPPLFVCFDRLSPSARRILYARADAYVSLHRAEGFGLCMAEAMAAGKPVIATAWSGNLEFMDETSALLVPYRLVPARQRESRIVTFERRMRWAEPDHDAAVQLLRSAVSDRARTSRIAARGAARVRSELAPARIGTLMRQRIDA